MTRAARVPALAAALLAAVAPCAARADATHTCATAAYDAQRLRDEGKLTEAHAALLRCASRACPAVVVTDCTRWLGEVDARLPSVVLGARDAAGHDVLRARVYVDGALLTESLDGRSLPLDPGPHTFRFEDETGASAEQTAVLREGEKSRPITVSLPAPAAPTPAPAAAVRESPAPPPPRDDGGAPWPAIVAVGVGVVALGDFAFFGVSGQSDKNRLADGCAPSHSCSASDVGAARTKLVIADVSLGVGVLALGVATWLFVRHAGAERAKVTASSPPRNARAPAPR